MPPPLPLTVMGYVPIGVLDPTVMVMVELPDPGAGMGLGLKLTVVPEGRPEADRAIGLLKPLPMAVVMVEVPWLPWTTLTEDGEAERVKPGAAVTVMLSGAIALAGGDSESLTCTVKLEVPAVVGVPEITPLLAFRVKP